MFKIIEIPKNEIDKSCLMTAFPFMVENTENNGRWFGAETYEECVYYIENYTINV